MGYERRSNWKELVALYRNGNESKAVFCKRHALKLSTLKYWLYEKDNDKPKKSQFLPVIENIKVESDIKIELKMSSGAQLTFSRTPPVFYLAQLLAALS